MSATPTPSRPSVSDNLFKPNLVWGKESKGTTSSEKRQKVVIIGGGLAGLVTAMELLESPERFEVTIYEGRPFVGGKVGSWVDKDGNHIEMGLHVFFGCYYNLFDIMKKLGTFESLLLKEHRHIFVNEGGKLGELDFRMGPVGAPINGLKAFATTGQLKLGDKLANALALGLSPIVKGLFNFDAAMDDIRALDDITFSDWFQSKGGSRGSIERMWNPVAYALGFIDCDHISARCMLTIFQLFAVRSEASILRLLEGSPARFLTGPMVKFIEERGGQIKLRKFVRDIRYTEAADGSLQVVGIDVAVSGEAVESIDADIVVCACDVPGAKKIIPQGFRKYPELDNIFKLDTVPVITVQLRFDGWVTELNDISAMKDVEARGLDNLLYSADADFSCFADLALTSPSDYYRQGQGSLLQCVLTPADPYMPLSDEVVAAKVLDQVRKLFPSSRELQCTWSSVVKLGESLYRECPGTDLLRPRQQTPIAGFYLAGSYTQQDYIDSMEGACKSGRLAASRIVEKVLQTAVV